MKLCLKQTRERGPYPYGHEPRQGQVDGAEQCIEFRSAHRISEAIGERCQKQSIPDYG